MYLSNGLRHVPPRELSSNERIAVISLLREAFSDDDYIINTTTAFLTEPNSDYGIFSLLFGDGELIGLAISILREVRIFGGYCYALTTGPIAIRPAVQGRGFGQKLLDGIHDIALKSGCSFAYVQGIRGYYARHGYYPCLAKSKLEIRATELPDESSAPAAVSLRPLAIEDIGTIQALFECQAGRNTFTARRTPGDWRWLVGLATHSWYFHQPRAVLAGGRLVGYFTSDRNCPWRLREVVCDDHPASIQAYLIGLRIYARANASDMLEIMLPRNAQLRKYMTRRYYFEYKEYHSPDGGQLLRIVNADIAVTALNVCLSKSKLPLTVSLSDESLNISSVQSNASVRLEKREFTRLILGEFSSLLDQADSLDLDEESLIRLEALACRYVPFVYQGDNF